MIELSPKALRFARLAAEEHQRAADKPLIQDLIRRESDHATRLFEGSPDSPRYLLIPNELARFCLRNIRVFLQKTGHDSDWDENDLLFMKTVSKYLAKSLSSIGR